MTLLFLFVLGVLSIRGNTKPILITHGKSIFWLVFLFSIGIGIYNTFLQYFAWADGELTNFLTPQYQPTFFFFYVLMRIWAPYTISLLIAGLIINGLSVVNKRFEGKFFEKNENYLAGTVIFVVGHPGWLIYLAIFLSTYLVWHLFNLMGKNHEARLSLFGLWAWIGVLTILVNEYFLVGVPLWSALKI